MMHSCAFQSKMYSMHQGEISRLRREFANSTSGEQAPRPPSCECEVDSMSKLIEPHRIKLHNYDARCCIIIMERYRSGDVAERCLWQKKRGIRSGSGQNLAKRIASNKFWTPQQDITGLTRKRLTIVTKSSPQTLEILHFFGILSADFSEVGRQFSIKIPTIKYVQYASKRDISPTAMIR